MAENGQGTRLERLMLRRGFETQAALAEASGVSKSAISLLVSGRNEDPRPETASKLALALGVPKIWFYAETPGEYMVQRILQNLSEFRKMPLHRKLAWVLEELEQTWSDEFSVENIAQKAGMEVETVRQILEGRIVMQNDYFLNFICEVTGVPVEFFCARMPTEQGGLPPAYMNIAETAYLLGLDPDAATELLVTAHRMCKGSKRRGQ